MLAPAYSHFPRYPDKQNLVKDPDDYFKFCDNCGFEYNFGGGLYITKLANKPRIIIPSTDKRNLLNLSFVEEVKLAESFGLDRNFVIRAYLYASAIVDEWDHYYTKRELEDKERIDLTEELNLWLKMKVIFIKDAIPELIDYSNGEIERINKRLRYLVSKNSPLLPRRKSFDLEQIKRTDIVQIAKYAGYHVITTGHNRHKMKCPYHDENTPSFVLYSDNNTFHCFGCQAHGDVISLYMKLNQCNFIEACKALE